MQKKQKGKLLRSFGLGMAVILVISSIVGSGVFKEVAPIAKVLGSPFLVITAWVIAGIIILCGVLSIGELTAIFPDSGGPFLWLEKIYGRLFSFLYGWSCFTVIQSAAIASVAFVFAGAVDTFIPLPHLSPELEEMSFLGIHFLNNIGAKIVVCLMLIGITIANIRGAKQGGLISKIFTFSIIIGLVLVVVAAFSSTVGSWETFETPSSTYPVEGFGILAFISAIFIATRYAFWAFEGWIALGFVGEEIKKPRKNMPKALAYGILLILLIYVIVNIAYLYVMPIDEMTRAMAGNENSIAAVLVVDKLFGNRGAYIVSALIMISTFGCTNATSLVSSRVYYAMAREGWFFKSVKKTHKKFKTPHKALRYQCVWACLLTLSGSFALLTTLVVIAAFVFYGMVVFGVVVLRKKHPELERPYKTFGYPVVPLIFTLFCLVLLIVSFIESPMQSVLGVGLILSGLPFYFYWRHKKKDRRREN